MTALSLRKQTKQLLRRITTTATTRKKNRSHCRLLRWKCYCCGKPGHKSPNCHKKDKIPKDEWAINKSAQQHLNANSAKEETINISSGSSVCCRRTEPVIGWAGAHMSFAQVCDLKELILLDSDSTDTVFCNPKYVTNIVVADNSLDIHTNGGVIVTKKKCQVPHLGEVWYNENSMANIISLKDMVKLYRVTFDSTKEKAFEVHMPNKVVKFKQFANGLYAMDPTDKDSYTEVQHNMQLLQTVKENMKFLSERQQLKVKKARELLHAMGTPTVDDLKAMIRMNLIRNNQVTTDDVNLAEKVYGPDIGSIKGKTTRSKPTPVETNIIEIPDELLEVQKDITMSMDGLMVNSLHFLSTIAHDIYYRTTQYVSDPIASVYEVCLDEVLATYKKGGFTLAEVHCDNEFRKVMDKFVTKHNPPIRVNYAAAQEHVPRAERIKRLCPNLQA